MHNMIHIFDQSVPSVSSYINITRSTLYRFLCTDQLFAFRTAPIIHMSKCTLNNNSQHDLVQFHHPKSNKHYNEVIMDAIASKITSLAIVYLAVYSDADQRKQVPRHRPLCGEITGTGEFPAQMASNAEIFLCDDVTMHIEISATHFPTPSHTFRLWLLPDSTLFINILQFPLVPETFTCIKTR